MRDRAYILLLFLILPFAGCHLQNDEKEHAQQRPHKAHSSINKNFIAKKSIYKKPVSNNIYMDKQAAEIKKGINHAKVSREGEDIKIIFDSGISFDSNSDTITSAGKKNITNLSKILKKYPDTKVIISGHTDNTGSEEYNLQLSKRRAASVARYATSKGINDKRFTISGYGEEKPVADNNTEGGKKLNRRVEITIISEHSDHTPFVSQKENQVDSNCYCSYDEYHNFICKRLCDSWEKVPVSSRINPNNNDALYLTASGNKNSLFGNFPNAKGINNTDAQIILTGKVYDAKTKKPIEAEIIFETLPEGEIAGISKSNTKGRYELALKKNNHYGYMAQAKGYLAIRENIKIPEMQGYAEIRQDLYLVPIESGQQIKLNNVFFLQSKAVLLPSSYSELNEVIKFLKNNPAVTIELHGHTDANGDPNVNYLLSKKRVSEIKKYLVSKGIDDDRVALKAFGDTMPIASNDTEETRKLNRRVEFIIVRN